MKTVYVSSTDVGASLKLKELIGRERVARFRPDQHPLGLGFAALQKQVVGLSPLSFEEARALGRLNLLSQAIFAREADWQPIADRLAADLGDSHECLSIEFELQVIDFSLREARDVAWIRYREGTPDISCSEPALLVECKLLRAQELTRDTLFDAVALGGRQHRDESAVPIVVAVGFDKILSTEALELVHRECQNRGPWFRQRPKIAGVLMFLPKEFGQRATQTLGLPALWTKRGDVIEIVNHRAKLQLPVGFSSPN